MKTEKISYEEKDGLAYIGFGYNSKKSVAILDRGTLEELGKIVDHLGKQSLQGAIFFSHIKGCFLAGADINMISNIQSESEGVKGAETGQELFNRIEDLPYATVALVDGHCLGGGLEMALSCDKILASETAGLGVPEVKLGILPGFGGTYRLTHRLGLPDALDMILTGRTVRGKKAKKIGLINETYPAEVLLKFGKKAVRNEIQYKSSKKSISKYASENFLGRKFIFQKARETVLKQTKGHYQAPLKILSLLEGSQGKSRTAHLSMEAQAFGELAVSLQSKNLQHIFFLTEEAKKIPGSKKDLTPIHQGAVLGAGTMGGGIAWLFADAKQRPLMKDLNKDALELGYRQASKNYQHLLKRKKITQDDFERKMRSIRGITDYSGFHRVDMVVEAIVEDMEIKKKVFKELETKVPKDAIIVSNTSSLSVTEMSSVLEHPERFGGLHFFNPVNRMPLVEIITHEKMSKDTIARLYNWALKAKKTPVVVKDGPGFLVNRILMPYLNEAGHLLKEGVSIESLDRACLNFGMPMGPCRLMDEVGHDVLVKVAKIMHDGLGERAKPIDVANYLVEKNFLGKKSDKGMYLYDHNGKELGVNREVQDFLNHSIEMDETTIQKRVFLPMINEAAHILDEGLVKKAGEVDLGMIFGTGFPPFRGGPLRYADFEGPERILSALEEFAGSVSKDRYKPSKYLVKMVKEKRKFYEMS